jgi:hypothetical protein
MLSGGEMRRLQLLSVLSLVRHLKLCLNYGHEKLSSHNLASFSLYPRAKQNPNFLILDEVRLESVWCAHFAVMNSYLVFLAI